MKALELESPEERGRSLVERIRTPVLSGAKSRVIRRTTAVI